MCPAGPGSEPSRRPGERASLPKRAGGLLPIPREDPGPDSWAPQGGGERNPEAAAEAGDMEPSLCRHLERSADPAQLLFTAPAGVGWGGALCSLFAARPQGTSSLAGGLASSLPPHRARKPRPRKGKCALQECPAGSLRTECRSLRHPLCRPPGRRPRRGSWGGAGAQEARGHDTACWWPVWCRPPQSHGVNTDVTVPKAVMGS